MNENCINCGRLTPSSQGQLKQQKIVNLAGVVIDKPLFICNACDERERLLKAKRSTSLPRIDSYVVHK